MLHYTLLLKPPTMYVEKTPHGFNIIGMPNDVFRETLIAIKTAITGQANGNGTNKKTKDQMETLRRRMQNEIH